MDDDDFSNKKHIANFPQNQTNLDIYTDIRPQGYKINENAALEKKLSACDRDAIVIHTADGNNFIIDLNTAAFEIVRHALATPRTNNNSNKIKGSKDTPSTLRM